MKKRKIAEPTRPTWGATLTPAELLQLLDLLEQKRMKREADRLAENSTRAAKQKLTRKN